MHPLFHVGAWRISSYLALHWVGIALGAILGWRELRRAHLGAAQAGATLLALVIAAHLGAHAYHVLTNPAHYLAGGGDWHDCVTNGLALNGGILGAYVGLLAAARVLRVESWRLADALAPGGALALGVFRIGCWAEGCCYGRRLAAGSWFEGISTRLVGNQLVSLYPTQLFCAGFAFGLFAWMWARRRRKRYDGELVIVGMLAYSTWRFVIEFWRADTPKDIRWLGPALSSNQVMALALLALGLAFRWNRRGVARAAA